MATVDPRYFDWGGRFQEGQETARRNRLQDIAFGQQQEDRAMAMEDRSMRLNAMRQQQEAQQTEKQYATQLREATTLFNAAKALKGVPLERRRQALEQWGARNPIIAGALQQIPPETDLSDAGLDEFAASMGIAVQGYGSPQGNSDFLRAVEILRNQNASPQERQAAEVALGLKARAIETRPQLVQTIDPATGQIRWESINVGGGQLPQGAPKPDVRETPTTEAERKAAGFYDRMTAAGEILNKLEETGYKPGGVRDTMTAGQGWRNYLATPEGQNYRQAQENWVRANLRKESGAVIGPEEMEREIVNYFAQPGDKEDVIRQKQQNRKILEQNMLREAGRAYKPLMAQPPQQGQPSSQPRRLKYNPETGALE